MTDRAEDRTAAHDERPSRLAATTERGAILVVDDDEMTRDILSRRLQRLGHTVVLAANGGTALEMVRSRPFDIVLLDIKMPGIGGFEVLKAIREVHSMVDLPVVMVTASDDSESIVEALELGANDYVTKPIDLPVAMARVRTHLLLKRLVAALAEANRKLERLSFLDGLTNIANRRRFDGFLEIEWKRATREGVPMSVILIDIDSFKAYNDTYGHEAGDDVLRTVASTLAGALNRPADLMARYGGEEFVAVLPSTNAEGARFLAERLRAGIEALGIPHTESPAAPHVTISLGVATIVPRRDASPQALVAAADQALYEAKRAGRNQVRVCDGPDAPAPPGGPPSP